MKSKKQNPFRISKNYLKKQIPKNLLQTLVYNLYQNHHPQITLQH